MKNLNNLEWKLITKANRWAKTRNRKYEQKHVGMICETNLGVCRLMSKLNEYESISELIKDSKPINLRFIYMLVEAIWNIESNRRRNAGF